MHHTHRETPAHRSGVLGAVVTLITVLLTPVIQAQTTPDAGSLQQQLERDRRPALPQRGTLPDMAAPTGPSLATGDTTVEVKLFRVLGNTLLTPAQIDAVLAPYRNKPLGLPQLQEAADALGLAYRAQGGVVRTTLPKQDVTDGIVTIQVLESAMGAVQIEGAGPVRSKLAHVLGMIQAAQPQGQVLDGNALDRALLLADDLPGAAVNGSLRQGDKENTTDLSLKFSDEPAWFADASLDNNGARSTGNIRLAANASLNSPLGLGDSASLSLLHTQGSDYVRAAFSLPVGLNGWRAGLSTSLMRYKLVSSDFAALGAKGTSTTFGLDASYPLLRSRTRNVYLNLNADRKQLDNQSNGATQSHYGVNTLSAGLSGNLYDNLGGNAATNASLTLVKGRVNQGTLDVGENPALAGGFSKLRYALSRQQPLGEKFSLLAAVSGQSSASQLDSSEKFYLGGPAGVRAYPVNEGSGTSGTLVSADLRWHLSPGLNLEAFADHGTVQNSGSSTSPQNYSLKGYGLGLRWFSGSGANFRLSLARRAGNNPNPTANGSDQDGTRTLNRLWATANLPF